MEPLFNSWPAGDDATRAAAADGSRPAAGDSLRPAAAYAPQPATAYAAAAIRLFVGLWLSLENLGHCLAAAADARVGVSDALAIAGASGDALRDGGAAGGGAGGFAGGAGSPACDEDAGCEVDGRFDRNAGCRRDARGDVELRLEMLRLELVVLLDRCDSARWQRLLTTPQRRALRMTLEAVLATLAVPCGELCLARLSEAQNRLFDAVCGHQASIAATRGDFRAAVGDPLMLRPRLRERIHKM